MGTPVSHCSTKLTPAGYHGGAICLGREMITIAQVKRILGAAAAGWRADRALSMGASLAAPVPAVRSSTLRSSALAQAMGKIADLR